MRSEGSWEGDEGTFTASDRPAVGLPCLGVRSLMLPHTESELVGRVRLADARGTDLPPTRRYPPSSLAARTSSLAARTSCIVHCPSSLAPHPSSLVSHRYGSAASRRPSPRKLSARTARMTAPAG